MERFFLDKVSITGANIKRTDEGFLIIPANLARTGIQVYPADQGGRLYRPANEVFRKETLDSFRGKSLTELHPMNEDNGVMINPANWKNYDVGTVLDTRQDGDYMAGDLIIKDAATIGRIESKIKRGEDILLSCGYYSDTIMSGGKTPTGEEYDGIMTNIRGNHVAIVPKGRAGENVKMLLDHFDNITKKEKQMAKVFFGDVALEVSDESVKALNDIIKANTELQAKFDTADAQVKKLEEEKKGMFDAAKVDELANELSAVRMLCDGLKIEHKDKKLDALKAEVLSKVQPDLKAKYDSGDAAYKGALWDATLPLANKAADNNKKNKDAASGKQTLKPAGQKMTDLFKLK